ncbi:MAG: glycosyltransferase [Candidatus Kapaibacteriota bacterium]|jgi:phosphatidylinositol alpha 1,6-mannosyltransferase
MRIAYFAESLEENKDGVARVIYKIDEMNNKTGVESLYVTSVLSETKEFNQFKTKSLPIPGYDGYRMTVSKWYDIYNRIKYYKPDLIHLHAPFALGRVATLVANELKIPCVSTYHTHFISYLKYHKAQILEPIISSHLKSVYNNCQLNLIPSQNVYNDLENIGIENMKVLPHGVDFNTFNTKFYNPEFKTQFSNKFTFLYVGRLVWEKNLKLMASVFNDLYNVRNDFELLIVGTGPADEKLKELLPNAKFLGFKTGRELSEIYASSDVFVFPSDTETFGNVTIEALASGLPCIVANGGGSADIIIDDFNGLKFEACSHEEFTNSVIKLLDNEEKFIELKSNSIKSSKQYSWEVVHETMITYYQELILKNLLVNKNIKLFPDKKQIFFGSALLNR